MTGFSIQRQKVFWAPKTCSGSQGSSSVLPRPSELPTSALASSGHGIFHKACPLINRFPRMFSGRGGISFNMIDGCKQQAGRAPGGNCSALLTYEFHILWPIVKVALICPTVGIRMSSSQPTSGNCELCIVELCAASVPSGDVPHEEVLRGGVPCGEVPYGEGLRGEVPQGEVPHGDVPHGVSHGKSVPRGAL